MDKKNKYFEKLKDPRWEKIRLKVFERDRWMCQSCHNTGATLCVYHRYYLTDRDPWDYPADALVTLCEACLQEERAFRDAAEQLLLKALRVKFFSADIKELAFSIQKMQLQLPADTICSVYAWAFENPEVQSALIQEYKKYLKVKRK